jgi:hypothetical protein
MRLNRKDNSVQEYDLSTRRIAAQANLEQLALSSGLYAPLRGGVVVPFFEHSSAVPERRL